MGATAQGRAFFFARNETVAQSEFTGPNFSHDDTTLFVNIQGDGSPADPGYVLAITGPFRRRR